jgi:hypothetical protein
MFSCHILELSKKPNTKKILIMKKTNFKKILLLFFLITMLFNNSVFADDDIPGKYTINGIVKDASSGELLIGASVYIKELKTGAVSNIYGFYSISIKEGDYNLIYSYIGYETIEKKVTLHNNATIDIEMHPKSNEMKEVVITDKAPDKNITDSKMSVNNLKIETIKKVPALFGEVDLVKTIQLLPGVQSGGEGSTGFFVRGGGIDQNLILLDEATVFNASHLMGFFSVFNQDAIKDVQLYKGGIPSIYGGRLSSILDVRMNDGNNKTFHAKGGIGTISSRLTIEGPIVKDKASFVVSARRTYADMFLLFSRKEDLRKTKLYFYDLNGKASYTIDKRNHIYLSAYTGRDIMGMSDMFRMSWGNKTLTTRWNHLFSDKIFSNLSLIFSDFDYLLGQSSGINAFDWKSNIKEYCLKNDYTYYINSNNTISFGIIANFHTFLPADIEGVGSETIIKEYKIRKNQSSESAIYLSNTQKIGKRIEVTYGVRYSKFFNIGPDTIYEYNSNYDTTGKYKVYKKGDFFNTYGGLEPRLNFRYTLNEVSSIKASYNRMMQYIQLATNSTSSMPIDLWFSCDPNIKPQIVDQVAMGYFRNFKDNMYEASVETYYKKTKNQIDFCDHAVLLANPYLDGQLRIGKGEAYGLEFLVRKNDGVLNGWISYTLSKSTRKVPEINSGIIYPSNYDRRHNLAIVLSYDITERITASANWVYYTGVPFTAPTGKFNYQNTTCPVYSDRNKAKLPDYHRLDLSVTLKNKKKPNRKWESEWNLSVYNVYNRKNPYSITFREKKDNPEETEAVMFYLFPVLPAITYNFKF